MGLPIESYMPSFCAKEMDQNKISIVFVMLRTGAALRLVPTLVVTQSSQTKLRDMKSCLMNQRESAKESKF